MNIELNNPYLTIINDQNKYTPEAFKSLQYQKIPVKMGDWFKKTGLIETTTLSALQNAELELESIGGRCTINSAGRTQFDQVYAKVEKFAGVLKKTKSIKRAIVDTKSQVARIGYSEHLSGLAVDLKIETEYLIIPEKIRQKYPTETDESKLKFLTKRLIMERNGFILRYPMSERLKDVTGVAKPEGWHWRYIGPKHSQMMARLRERVNEEVFLEDYIKLLEFNIEASNDNELLDKYVDLFQTEILGNKSNLTI